MPVDFRPLRSEEIAAFMYSGRVGFGGSTADAEIARRVAEMESGQAPLDWTLCAFDDGVLASKLVILPLRISWNRGEIGCGGITSVTTLPSHRRRGYLRELLRRAFAAMREAGQPVAMLWASMAAIYQRFGFGIVSVAWRYAFNPRDLRFVEELPTPGRVRLVKSSEAAPLLREPYACFAALRTPMLRRDIELGPLSVWIDRLRLQQPDGPPLLVAVYEEAGEVLGYALYDVAQHDDWRPGPDQELSVSELVWLTLAAHRALIRYLASYDLARTIRIALLPADDPLFYHAQEPHLLRPAGADGVLLRVVDLVTALEERRYDTDGRLRFRFADDFCPWNDGVWELSVQGGRGRLRRSEAEADLCLGPRALALLVAGTQSATMLARAGLLAGADEGTFATADALFRTVCAPLCLDHF